MPHVKSEEGWLSVTEVLSLSIPKPFLNFWYGKLGTQKCEQIKRESQELGIEVHSLIEWQFKNPNTRLDGTSNSHRMVNNFWDKFVIPYKAEPLAMEVTLKNNKLKLQGTFDAIVKTENGLFIADWKTSNSLDKVGVPLQLSMYNYLHGEDINEGLAVRIDKETAAIQVVEFNNLKEYEKIWKACLKVARYIKYAEK